MIRRLLMAVGVATLLAGCGERTQTAQAPVKKSDGKAWDTTQTPYVAPGWKPGDQASWESQMRERVQGQNEYSRSAPAAPK